MFQISTKIYRWFWMCSALLTYCFSSVAYSVVLDFEDLAPLTNLTGSNYANLVWEPGNIGLSNENGAWFSMDETSSHPHSGVRSLDNAQGSTLMGIGFTSLVHIQGAYFAAQGNFAATTSIRGRGYVAGQEVAATTWLTAITGTPQWLDLSSLGDVDRIVIESVPVFENAGYYGMDDLTFTYVPEPSFPSLLAAGAIGLLRRRRVNQTGSRVFFTNLEETLKGSGEEKGSGVIIRK